MPTRHREELRYYRMADDSLAPAVEPGAVVAVDPHRDPRDGDLVAVREDAAIVIGKLVGLSGEPVLVSNHRPPLVLNGHPLLGVVDFAVTGF